MPIYEYSCTSCKLTFARLQPMGAGSDGITCPGCDSDQVERAISTFASATPSATHGAASCATRDTCPTPT